MSEVRNSAARRALGVTEEEARNAVVIERLSPQAPPQAPRNGKVFVRPVYSRTGYKTPPDGKQLYEATGGCGVISVRAADTVMRFATDVADPAGPTERQQKGRIRSFFALLKDANLQAEQLRAEGLVVTVVAARPYAGQPGDDE